MVIADDRTCLANAPRFWNGIRSPGGSLASLTSSLSALCKHFFYFREILEWMKKKTFLCSALVCSPGFILLLFLKINLVAFKYI